MFQKMYVCLQDRIPGWIVSLIIVLMLSWFTMSPEIMMGAGIAWSLLYWLAALIWCFFRALKAPRADAGQQ